ncbi:MAG: lytic murein transglycosylase, partial [bacterium]
DVERAFRDRRVGAFDGVDYALVVKDPKRSYRDFRTKHSLRAAKACRRRHARHFETFGSEHGVDPDVLAAILYIETRCGSYTGNRVVLRQLARLAMANEPANIADNIRRHKKEDEEGFSPTEIERLARERALYLHETFYPEVLATFRLADRVGINPVGLRGSGAGAFGWPQFLPSSYLRFAQDGNANGRISLYEPSDAIHSVAHFLRGHGWKPGLPSAEKRKILWQYNRSEPYIDTILLVAGRI